MRHLHYDKQKMAHFLNHYSLLYEKNLENDRISILYYVINKNVKFL